MPLTDPEPDSAEDIFNEALQFLGEDAVKDDSTISYGPLTLTVAPKEGKANTLLADHLFSPSLFLAERVERGLLTARDQSVIELGAGCALPSLLLSVLPDPPSLITVTDYPDEIILGNLRRNVERNRHLTYDGCILECKGYEWGKDVTELLNLIPASDEPGYDIIILSDLLHFHSSHDVLVQSIKLLLRKNPQSQIIVAAGRYTQPHICDNFIRMGTEAGLSFEEILANDSEHEWQGQMPVSRLDKQDLAVRKAACRFWVGRWM